MGKHTKLCDKEGCRNYVDFEVLLCDNCESYEAKIEDLKAERDELKLQVNTLETNSEGYARNAMAEVTDLRAKIEELRDALQAVLDTPYIGHDGTIGKAIIKALAKDGE